MANRLKRYEDWPARLYAAIREKADVRFKPGVHDCCISVCDVVEKMTGVDIAYGFRGKYGPGTIKEFLAENGGVEAIAISVSKEFQMEGVVPTLAQRGDVVLLDLPTGDTLGTVGPDGKVALACARTGWGEYPTPHWHRAWRV